MEIKYNFATISKEQELYVETALEALQPVGVLAHGTGESHNGYIKNSGIK